MLTNQFNIKVALKECLNKELQKSPTDTKYFCKDIDKLTDILYALLLPNVTEETDTISLFINLQEILKSHESLQDAVTTLKTRYYIVKKV